MTDIDDTVFNQCIIHIIDRDPDITGIYIGFVEFFSTDNITGKNSCDFLFQNLISSCLKIFINRQINVISGNRILSGGFIDLQYFSQIIYTEFFLTVRSLQLHFHILLDTGFSDYCIGGILRIVFLQFFQFFSGSFSGITDNGSKIFTVLINTNRIFYNIDTLQMIFFFHNFSYGFFAYICSNSCRHIFLKAVGRQGITNFYNIQNLLFCERFRKIVLFQFFFCVRLLCVDQTKTIFTAKICDHFFRGSFPFFFFQIINFCLAIDICFETI